MKIKSLALVASAVLTAGAAQAADLNHPAKVAVDYVKVCDAYGAGFFYIPGSDTCLQLSGYARDTNIIGNNRNMNTVAGRAPVVFGLGGSRTSNNFATFEQAEFDIDARTNTSFGLLRSYISLDVNYNSGAAGTNGATSLVLNRGFLQWGGLTAGHIESNFTFFQGYNEELFFSELGSDYQTNALSYTFTFGNGVTALIGIEDSATGTRTNGTSFTYQGNKAPDVVGYLNVTQAWGAAQLSGALHNVYGTGVGTLGTVNSSKWGYALQGGVWFNVPMIAAGDKIGFQGAYASGAIQYTSAGEIFQSAAYDLGVDATTVGGTTKLGSSWNAYASFVHNFTPTVNLAIGGGFEGTTNYSSGTGFAAPATLNNKLTTLQSQIGATLAWTPVKGMLIDFNLEYANTNFSGLTKADLGLRSDDSWIYGVRFKRSF